MAKVWLVKKNKNKSFSWRRLAIGVAIVVSMAIIAYLFIIGW